MATKGIILAGGEGTRLFPLTKAYSKQLVAVFDKPMIYYPLSTLIAANINDILIISNSEMLILYQKLLGNGKSIGLNISYAIQEKPNGIAESFIIAEDFIGMDNVCLILGDNIFYGDDHIFWNAVNRTMHRKQQHVYANHIFALYVNEPQRYGVVRFDDRDKPIEIIEKPYEFVSHYAVPGIYIYDYSVVQIAKTLTPSHRNELEITDINNILIKQNKIEISVLNKNITWLDCGTPNSLLSASNLVASIEERGGKKIGCYEELAYRMKFITKQQLAGYCNSLPKSEYADYLVHIANDTAQKHN